jgi:hypothetical protein
VQDEPVFTRLLYNLNMFEVDAEKSSRPEVLGVVDYNLKKGNKHVLLSVNRASAFAESFIENTRDAKIEGATTAIYKKVRKVLEQEAKNCGPITYQISTGFESMKAWVQNQGNDIFHWSRTYHPVDDSEKLIAETTIYPK